MLERPRTATRMGLREQARRPFLLLLLVTVPFVFISWSFLVTEPLPREITLPGGAQTLTDMKQLHGAIMVPITVGFLSGLIGLFIVRSALESDRRLVVAGFTPGEAIAPRLVVLFVAIVIVLAASLAVTSIDFDPRAWARFGFANLLAGLTYGGVGALAGAALGRLGGAYFMFFMPMMDFGIAQNPMFFDGQPQEWATALPGYGSTRVLIDAAFGNGFEALGPLLVGLAWLALVGIALVVVLRRSVAPQG